MSAFDIYRYDIVWEKTRPVGFLSANKMPLCVHEQILVFYKRLPVYHPQYTSGAPYVKNHSGSTTSNYGSYKPCKTVNDGRRYPKDVIKFPPDKKCYGHPTAKPVALIEWLIKSYSNEGDTVLDNCMGSGTTAVASMNTGRNFIGFELNKHYWEIGCERIEKCRKELSAQQETHGQTEKKSDGCKETNPPGG